MAVYHCLIDSGSFGVDIRHCINYAPAGDLYVQSSGRKLVRGNCCSSHIAEIDLRVYEK
jgi:hypothetical protein